MAMEVGAGTHVKPAGKRLIWFSPLLFAERKIIVYRLLKGATQGCNVRPLIANEATNKLDFAIKYLIIIAVMYGAGVAFIGHHIFHSMPSRSSVSMIWSI